MIENVLLFFKPPLMEKPAETPLEEPLEKPAPDEWNKADEPEADS
jgi:hypothetical protein